MDDDEPTSSELIEQSRAATERVEAAVRRLMDENDELRARTRSVARNMLVQTVGIMLSTFGLGWNLARGTAPAWPGTTAALVGMVVSFWGLVGLRKDAPPRTARPPVLERVEAASAKYPSATQAVVALTAVAALIISLFT